jgi:hypothetical protein
VGRSDQSERAVFAVYSSLFDIVEPVSEVINEPAFVNGAIKSLLKFANNIRRWAQ